MNRVNNQLAPLPYYCGVDFIDLFVSRRLYCLIEPMEQMPAPTLAPHPTIEFEGHWVGGPFYLPPPTPWRED